MSMGGFFVGLTRGALVFGMAVAVTLVAPGAGRADSLRAAMSDAYVNSALLEQNRFLLRLDDEGVAQAVSRNGCSMPATAAASPSKRRARPCWPRVRALSMSNSRCCAMR